MQGDHIDEGWIHEYKGQTTRCSRVSEKRGERGEENLKKKRKTEHFVLTLTSSCHFLPLKPVNSLTEQWLVAVTNY